MEIKFKNIIPFPLKESLKSELTEVWNQPNCVISTGSKVLIHAPSGKGKSTFLNIIFGVRKDYKGELGLGESNGGSLLSKDWDDIRKSKLSMVHQGLQLFDHLTAWENIELKNGITKSHSPETIEEFMTELGIFQFKNKPAKTLSFGQKQRVAIIRALCQPFSWLLLDEPFSHLDDDNAEKALKLILSQAEKQDAGILLTSLGNQFSEKFTHTLKL